MQDKEITTKLNNIRMSSQKLRLVANLVKKMSVEEALAQLDFCNKKGAHYIKKALQTAIANAKELNSAKRKNLKIKDIFVNEAVTYKRGKAVSRGRYFKILKRGSNLTIKLSIA
jgi:large subunit ribosomal protein L22